MTGTGMWNIEGGRDDTWNADTLWWVITGNCNMKCRHCYIEAPTVKYHELSLKECMDVVVQCQEAGIRDIFLTGGEPFVRNDLVEVIDAIYDGGLSVRGIETNGTLITRAVINHIKSRNIAFHVSWDGMGYNEKLRGRKGADGRVLSAISLLKESGCPVFVNSIFNGENGSSLLRSLGPLKGLHVDGWRIFVPARMGRWKRTSGKIPPDEEATMYLRIMRMWVEQGKPFNLALGSLLVGRRDNTHDKGHEDHACGYFRSAVTLLPDGTLLPCCRYLAVPEIMSEAENVFHRPIRSQLERSTVKAIKNLRIEDLMMSDSNRECRRCSLRLLCDLGCRVNAYLESKSLTKRELRHCLLMKRYYMQHFYQLDYRDNMLEDPM